MPKNVDISEQPAYKAGNAWATEIGPSLAEYYSNKQIDTQELRTRLWDAAARRFKPTKDSMDGDIDQTLFVAGAFKPLMDTLHGHEGFLAMVEAAEEMGAILSSEVSKAAALEELKAKPVGWWRKKVGAGTPLDVVNILAARWWRDHPEARTGPGKWRVLIDYFGSREMYVLANLVDIEEHGEGETYHYWTVLAQDPDEPGRHDTFDIMAADARHEGGIVSQYRGDIVG